MDLVIGMDGGGTKTACLVAPMTTPANFLPLPVAPAAATSKSRCAFLSARMPSFTASIGLPRVLKYEEPTKDPDSSSSTRLVLTEPTSTPM
jgi:hypothetical protein